MSITAPLSRVLLAMKSITMCAILLSSAYWHALPPGIGFLTSFADRLLEPVGNAVLANYLFQQFSFQQLGFIIEMSNFKKLH